MTIQCLKGLTRLYHVEEDYDRVFWSTELPADLGGNGSCLDRSAGKVARTGSSRDGAEPAVQSNEGAAGCNEISKTREELTLVFALGETTHSPRTSKANETNHLSKDCHLGVPILIQRNPIVPGSIPRYRTRSPSRLRAFDARRFFAIPRRESRLHHPTSGR